MLTELTSNIFAISAFIVVLSFLMVYFIIPRVIWINKYHRLMDDPDYRSSHKSATPTMAGFSFFLALVIIVFFISRWDNDGVSLNYIAAIVIVFSIGLKDDLAKSSPLSKIYGEIIALLFIIFCNCMDVPSLEGFLGIHSVPLIFSRSLIILTILTIINSYNLIDGIDGLAASIGITIFSIYALIFFTLGLNFYFLLSLSFIGMLIAYLRYNISNTDKIFMGDTGSLIIGFTIGFLTLKFLSMEPSQFSQFNFLPENKIIVVVSILCIPLFDTFRVIVIRLLKKKSPFYPDRNHVHHVLIDSGLTHYSASLVLAFINYIVVIFLMVLLLLLVYLLYIWIFYKLKKNITAKKLLNNSL